jgi:pimeloyl-ACP methyl ester carboxylesterase
MKKTLSLIITACLAALICAGCTKKAEQNTPAAQEKLPALAPTIGLASIPAGTTETHSYRPAGEGPFPAIYFLQGYPCRTINPDHEKSRVRTRLINAYVQAGFLVFMAEKPGMGELSETAETSKPCKDLTYPEEVAAFSAAFSGLENNPDVRRDQIFLFGHSMGGQTAPLIAKQHKVAGIITYGIHAKPWFEFMIDISRDQGERLGMDPVQLQEETAMMIPFLYDLMVSKQDWATLSARHAKALSGGVMPAKGRYINGRDYTFWASLNDENFVKAWSEYEGQVLALYGEYDIASISAEGAERIARAVNFHHSGHAKAVILEKTDHNFAYFDGSFDAYKAKRFSNDWTGDYVSTLVNPRITEDTIAWMKSVIANTEMQAE